MDATQAQTVIDLLTNINNNIGVLVTFVVFAFVVWVIKAVYWLFNNVFFGGV